MPLRFQPQDADAAKCRPGWYPILMFLRHSRRFRFGDTLDTTGPQPRATSAAYVDRPDSTVKLLITMAKVLRTLATVVAAPAIAGIALAGTAAADPPLLNGTYGSTDGDPYNVWTFATSCAPAGCTGTVTSNTRFFIAPAILVTSSLMPMSAPSDTMHEVAEEMRLIRQLLTEILEKRK